MWVGEAVSHSRATPPPLSSLPPLSVLPSLKLIRFQVKTITYLTASNKTRNQRHRKPETRKPARRRKRGKRRKKKNYCSSIIINASSRVLKKGSDNGVVMDPSGRAESLSDHQAFISALSPSFSLFLFFSATLSRSRKKPNLSFLMHSLIWAAFHSDY